MTWLSRFKKHLFNLRQNRPELFPETAKLRSFNIHYGEDELLHLYLTIELPAKDITDIKEKIDVVSQEMTKELNQPVKINLDIVPFQRFESQP